MLRFYTAKSETLAGRQSRKSMQCDVTLTLTLPKTGNRQAVGVHGTRWLELGQYIKSVLASYLVETSFITQTMATYRDWDQYTTATSVAEKFGGHIHGKVGVLYLLQNNVSG
jgi:hypothetical protein